MNTSILEIEGLFAEISKHLLPGDMVKVSSISKLLHHLCRINSYDLGEKYWWDSLQKMKFPNIGNEPFTISNNPVTELVFLRHPFPKEFDPRELVIGYYIVMGLGRDGAEGQLSDESALIRGTARLLHMADASNGVEKKFKKRVERYLGKPIVPFVFRLYAYLKMRHPMLLTEAQQYPVPKRAMAILNII